MAKVQALFSEKRAVVNERDDYQNRWDISQEELEQKREIISNYLQKTDELNNEKTDIIRSISTLLQPQLTNENITGDYATLISQIEEVMRKFAEVKGDLTKWTGQFPNPQTPETVQGKINNLTTQLTTANNTISQKNTQITDLTSQVRAWNNRFSFANGNPDLVKAEIDRLNNELQRERGWWNKWFNSPLLSNNEFETVKRNLFQIGGVSYDVNHTLHLFHAFSFCENDNRWAEKKLSEGNGGLSSPIIESRKLIKAIYMYYRDQ